MDDRDIALLAASPLFAGADLLELGSYLRTAPVSVRSYPPGSTILLAGSAYEELRVILAGEASAEMADGEGRAVVVETLKAPDAVATAVLFAPERRLPVSVSARSEARLASIPRGVLLGAAARFPSVLEALLLDMGSRLAFLAAKYRSASFATLGERLADWLLERAERDGSGLLSVTLPETKERLAAALGVARPSLSRELSRMEDRGLLAVRGRRIEILDERGLRRALSR